MAVTRRLSLSMSGSQKSRMLSMRCTGKPVMGSVGQLSGAPILLTMPLCLRRMPPLAGLPSSMTSNSGRLCAITSHSPVQQV